MPLWIWLPPPAQKFIREIMSGVYASDYGLWDTDPGAIVRHQMKLGLKNVKTAVEHCARSGQVSGRSSH